MLAGPIYLDASAWVKPYLNESGSAEIDAHLARRTDVVVSDLGLTEAVSAICRRTANAAGQKLARRLQAQMLAEIRAGFLSVVPLTPAVHRAAESLLFQTGMPRLRAADALHLALSKHAGAVTMACYDQRLRAAAEAQGLRLLPE
ncbi:MAG: type II toxin-antitoxin system VapC family toxin [Terriglobales bacterium]